MISVQRKKYLSEFQTIGLTKINVMDLEKGKQCLHINFTLEHRVIRINENGDALGKAEHFRLEIQINCQDCLKPFSFTGVAKGFAWGHPTTDIQGLKLSLPVAPI